MDGARLALHLLQCCSYKAWDAASQWPLVSKQVLEAGMCFPFNSASKATWMDYMDGILHHALPVILSEQAFELAKWNIPLSSPPLCFSRDYSASTAHAPANLGGEEGESPIVQVEVLAQGFC